MTAILRLLLDVVLALVAPRAVLVTENLLLRQQLIVARRQVERPRFRRFDRWLIGALAGRFRRFVGVVLLVKPETVIGWHRAGWRILWRWRSRRPSGRPPVDSDVRSLIRRMWRENPTWGEDRIGGELAKLGYRVSPRTVAKYRPAGLRRQRGQRWMTFIRNHLDETWACDFCVIVTARFRVVYVFVVLSLGRRRLVHFGALGAYLGYYHGRPHRGLRMQPPDGGRHLTPRRPTRGTRIATTPILGGLHHRYGFVRVGLAAPTSNEAVA